MILLRKEVMRTVAYFVVPIKIKRWVGENKSVKPQPSAL